MNTEVENTQMKSGAAVWQEFVVQGAILPKIYDQDFVHAVAVNLGLPEAEPSIESLDKAGISARDLLRAMLRVLEPIAGMLRDLLNFYTEIGANSADGDSLTIHYEFDEGEEIDILLANFRRDVVALESAMNFAQWTVSDQNDLWSFPFGSNPRVPVSTEVLEKWRHDFVVDRVFNTIPKFRPTVDPVLNDALDDVYDIFQSYLDWTHRHAMTWDELQPAWQAKDPALGTLVISHSDFWLPTSFLGLHDAVQNSTDTQATAEELQSWISSLPMTPPTTQHLNTVVSTLLDLPMWGKRHELYAAWLVTQVNASLPGRLNYVVTNGKFKFPFSGAKLANIQTSNGEMEFWTEKRSPAKNPVGKGRVSGVQPDYRFFSHESDLQETTTLAIEAKQYRNSRKKVHAEVLADYSNAMPNATIILAAYGPVSPTVKDSLKPDQAARIHVIRKLNPGDSVSRQEFARQVQQALPPARLLRAVGNYGIELTWNPAVDDVDLHAFCGPEHVFYGREKGVSATFSGHTTGGLPQSIQFCEQVEATGAPTSVWVHPYSSESSIAGARPRIRFTNQSDEEFFVPANPSTIPGLAWHVCDVMPDGRILWVDSYSPMPTQ